LGPLHDSRTIDLAALCSEMQRHPATPLTDALRRGIGSRRASAAAQVNGTAASEHQRDEDAEDRIVLIDKSAWEQRHHSAAARERIDRLAVAGRAATCLPVALEHLYSARRNEDFTQRRDALNLLVWLPISDSVESTALDIMGRLASKGQHRMPLPDIIIAATALVHAATIMHYDGDFERIAELTRQSHEWIVPRGEGHGRGTEDATTANDAVDADEES
jgi:hypothetical protein